MSDKYAAIQAHRTEYPVRLMCEALDVSVSGFYDAVAVRSGRVAQRYLSLDQGMVMAALGNELENDALKDYFVRGEVERSIPQLLRIETFNAGASRMR